MLEVNNACYSIGKQRIIDRISTAFEGGQFHVVMGANGAGKSTLLKLLAGEKQPGSGSLRWKGIELSDYKKGAIAKHRAVLSQHYYLAFPISVRNLVMMGRYPHFGSAPSKDDQEIVQAALDKMNMASFAERDYNTLSGGEAQKVQMARVLAQIWEGGEKILFLDEPVSHLDPRYQHLLLKTASELTATRVTVIAVLHDINLALQYADRLLLLKEGRLLYDLSQPGAIREHMITETFSTPAKIGRHEGRPYVFFY